MSNISLSKTDYLQTKKFTKYLQKRKKTNQPLYKSYQTSALTSQKKYFIFLMIGNTFFSTEACSDLKFSMGLFLGGPKTIGNARFS